jgi:hypothetical protein
MEFKKNRKKVFFLGVFLFSFFFGTIFFVLPSLSTDYSSSSFILRNPVITVEGGRSTSDSYTYFSSTGQLDSGVSDSTSYSIYGGFLHFPNITIPTLSATAGNAQVSLSWTASVSTFGYDITSYEVGQGTSSGGPYTYTDVGNVLSSTRSSLSNGTPYYFIVRVIDNQGDVVATSTESTATPVASTSPVVGGGGGGGGGGVVVSEDYTAVIFSGRAYPNSTVTILKDAQVASTTLANKDSLFEATVSGISAGNYIFSLYSEDYKGIRSSLLTFPVGVIKGSITRISDIFIAPTIGTYKVEVKKGEDIALFGQSTPNSEITIQVHSENEIFVDVEADEDGIYLHNLNTSPLELGQHYAKSKSTFDGSISTFSSAIGFLVGTKNITKDDTIYECKIADLNCDGRVNLVDFSIAAYWYKRDLVGNIIEKEEQLLNGDGKIDLIDFSIMAYHWTG